MKQEPTPVTVHILDKDYLISCEPDERESLLDSVRFLDTKMREIRSNGKVIGTDRIAVMAALNLAHELLGQQSQKDSSSESTGNRIRILQNKIEAALNSTNQLEL
ncbi:Z-ring-associated protein ZapA [hydrothermal vent metagenome]|uniref:Cell division protein ZapA n=1 Tax=hydrothermal vent metagenome TaxID=652676 RepID=A0A3B1C443_9ZZZZ